jgi:hypothetical protein
VATDGAFKTPRTRPGRYVVVAKARADDDQWEAAWLAVDLSFDMDDVVLALLPTGTIAGKIVTDDGSALPDGFQIAGVLADDGKEVDHLRRDRADPGPGGTFELRGMFGQRVLRPVGFTDGWKIDRMIANKVQVASFNVEPGSRIDDVLIVLKQQ